MVYAQDNLLGLKYYWCTNTFVGMYCLLSFHIQTKVDSWGLKEIIIIYKNMSLKLQLNVK